MLKVSFQLQGAEALIQKVENAQARCRDLSPAFIEIQQDFFDMERERFATQPWTPLSPDYRRWKENFAPGLPIMVLTGALRDSLTRKTDQTISEIYTQKAVFGTRARSGELNGRDFTAKRPYALAHQYGRGVPVRKLIELSANRRGIWTSIIARHCFRDFKPTTGMMQAYGFQGMI